MLTWRRQCWVFQCWATFSRPNTESNEKGTSDNENNKSGNTDSAGNDSGSKDHGSSDNDSDVCNDVNDNGNIG